ncbi:MAG: hypothetical protein JWO96_856 [Candidatus Saccharibacteria bacterium]|nr:hypothetical protein [Candidatus Saccharibacteria bacterium]
MEKDKAGEGKTIPPEDAARAAGRLSVGSSAGEAPAEAGAEQESPAGSFDYQQFKEVVEQLSNRERAKVTWGTRLYALNSHLLHKGLPPIMSARPEALYDVDIEKLKQKIPTDLPGRDHQPWLNREEAEERMFEQDYLIVEGVEAYLAMSPKERRSLGGSSNTSDTSNFIRILSAVVAEAKRLEQGDTAQEPPK